MRGWHNFNSVLRFTLKFVVVVPLIFPPFLFAHNYPPIPIGVGQQTPVTIGQQTLDIPPDFYRPLGDDKHDYPIPRENIREGEFIDPSRPEFYERYSSPLLGVLAQMSKEVMEGFTLELLEFYSEVAAYREQLISLYGESRLVEILENAEKDSSGRLKVEAKKRNWLEGSMILIDDVPVIRIIHKPSSTAFIIIDDPRVEKNSVHLSQLISRHFMISNQPKPGVHLGYDNVIMRITPNCSGGTCDITGYAKPIKFSDRAQHYLNAFHPRLTKKTGERWWQRELTETTIKNLYAGSLTGAYQAAILAGIGATPEQAIFTFGFSVLTNLNLPGFRRWNNQGAQQVVNLKNGQFEYNGFKELLNPSQWQEKGSAWTLAKDLSTKPVRRSTMSWAFRLGLVFLGVGGGFNVSFESVLGFANLATNILVSNANSTWWIEPVRLRAEERMNKKPLFKPDPTATREQTKKMYPMDSFEENLRYNLLWTVSILDVMGLATISFLMPGVSFPITFSAWKMALVGLAALGRWRAVKYAEKINHPKAGQMRSLFEDTFYMKAIRWTLETPPGRYAANFSAENLTPTAEKLFTPLKNRANKVVRKCSAVLNLNY